MSLKANLPCTGFSKVPLDQGEDRVHMIVLRVNRLLLMVIDDNQVDSFSFSSSACLQGICAAIKSNDQFKVY